MATVSIESNLPKKLSSALVHIGSFTPNYVRTSLTPKRTHLDRVAETFESELEAAGKKTKNDLSVHTKLANNHGGLPFTAALAMEVGIAGVIASTQGMARNFGYYKKSSPAYY